jgi:hypothetical protein
LRRRRRDPRLLRPWQLFGIVTSTMSGANFVTPSHHAAVIPVAVALGP